MALTREQREKLAHMRAVATSLIRCYCNGPGLPADHPQRAALANIAICAREMLEDDEADAAEASSSRARLVANLWKTRRQRVRERSRRRLDQGKTEGAEGEAR